MTQEKCCDFRQILAELAEKGTLLNNLYQTDNGIWIANVRDKEYGYEFARGADPVKALQNCIEIIEAKNRKKLYQPAAESSIEAKTPVKKLSLGDLLNHATS